MKTIPHALLLVGLGFLTGCGTKGSSYAKAHPELSAIHRNILTTGKIPGGLAVEGMTKEQVRLAVGNPATEEKINGEDAWTYFGSGMSETSAFNTYSAPFTGAADPNRNFTETEHFSASQKQTKTTIYFRGDRAALARITEERP